MRYPTCGAICGSVFLSDHIADLWFFYKKHPFPYCEQCVKCDRISSMKLERRVEGPDHNILAGKREKGGMRSQAFQSATYVNKIFASKQELEGVITMRKLKYGLLLVLTMILFSVPVLAAKTYYLPSDIKVEESREIEYKYDKHGHLISYYNKGNMDSFVWEYKYDKNGKRISGKRYCYGDLDAELTFDKNQRLKSLKDCWTNKKKEYTWTKNGYIQKAGNGLYKYYYYSDGKVKKSAYYVNGKLNTVSYYNKSGLLSKQVSKLFESTDEYEYKYGENGLVKEIRRNTTYSNGKKDTRSIYIYYSKTKTDRITYANFINGFDTCEGNALL